MTSRVSTSNLLLDRLRATSSDRRRHVLIDDVHLDLAPGQLHALIGPNGAGKTSLLRAVMGVLPGSGTIRLGEHSLDTLAPHQRARTLAYQPQHITFDPGAAAKQFVASARGARTPWLTGISDEDRENVERAMRQAGAESMSDRAMGTLSGGERARVFLASTLALGCRWLLLDEPLASADVAATRSLYRLLKTLAHDEGLGIVVVEHDLGNARSWADNVILIAGGRIVMTGAPDEVYASPKLEQSYGTRFKSAELGRNAWAVVSVDGEGA